MKAVFKTIFLHFGFALFISACFTSCGHKTNDKTSATAASGRNDTAKTKDTINANLAAHDNNAAVPVDGGVMVVSNNIIQNLNSPRELKIFLGALKKTGLDKMLQQNGPYTIFVPDNDAFRKIDERKSDTLMSESGKEELTRILKFHIVAGRLTTHDLVAGNNIPTIEGDQLVVIVDNGKTKLMDGQGNLSEITKPDLLSKNGVIHIINSVLMPKSGK